MPEISVIIPVYNQAYSIAKTIESIFAQTFKDLEIIIINDGSTDDVKKVLSRYDNKITLINQANSGAAAARNRGAAEARGNYLLFCDADLILKPAMFERMCDILQKNPDMSYAYSNFYYGFKKFKLWNFDEQKLKQMPYIHTTSLIRKKDFSRFDESLKRFQDWDLWLTMLKQGHTGIFIDEFLFTVTPGGSISRWIPKIFFKLPFKTKKVKEYKKAEEVIRTKHNL